MNVKKFSYILLCFLSVVSCKYKTIKQSSIKIPINICEPEIINMQFEEVSSYETSLRNLNKMNLAIYQLNEQLNNTITCYQDVIQNLN